MRNKSFILLMLILIGTIGIANAQRKKDDRNVLDYYKLLPSDMVALPLGKHQKTADKESGMETKISIEDIKNGYLRLQGAYDGWVEVALFRKKNGDPLLVVAENGCGPACGTELTFFEFSNGKMIDVSRKVAFVYVENEIDNKLVRRYGKQEDTYYGDVLEVLPRNGTTIKTVLENEKEGLLFEIEWKNDKFVVKRDVLDFYAIFPGNLLAPKSEEKGKVVVNDKKNGYLKIKAGDDLVEAVLFRKNNGAPVLFVAESICGLGDCSTTVTKIRELVKDKWVDVSGEVLPGGISEKSLQMLSSVSDRRQSYFYRLPRIGKTVEIVEGDSKKTVYKLAWKNDKFVIQ